MGTDMGSDEITDEVLSDEIDLLGEIITAAAGTCSHLSTEQIDSALGLAGRRLRQHPERRRVPAHEAASPTA